MSKLLTKQKVAELLSLHPESVMVMVRQGRFVQPIKFGEHANCRVRFPEQDVLDWCGGKLARFKQPRSVHFVDEIPRNPSGKILKRVLREEFPGPAPE